MSILVLAGDLTNYYLYKTLKENNYQVKLEGFNHLLNGQQKRNIILKGYKTIIAPIPLSIDGSILYSPYSDENIHIDQLFQKADKDSKIIGGPFNIKDGRIYDITKNKDFTDLTVIPTCEEIIKIIIDKSDFTICNSKITIIGNGRINNRLTPQLLSLGANIINVEKSATVDIIINTDKNRIFNNEYLQNLKKEILIIDVTSNDSDIDFKISKKFGIHIIKARGLPGKSAPGAVADYIYHSLIKENLI